MEFTVGQIRAFEVLREAWALMKPEFGAVFGIVIVGMIVGSVLPGILTGPMMVGLFICLIDKVDGGPARFDKLFKGFDRWAAGLIVALIIFVPLFLFFLIVYIPLILMSLYAPAMHPDQLLPFIVGVLLGELAIGLIMTLLHSLLIFAFPLIADKNLGGLAAARLSAKAAWANRGGVAGLFGVCICVALAGYALFCIGIYVALPVIMMVTTVAYRKVFPREDNVVKATPPSSNAYQGL